MKVNLRSRVFIGYAAAILLFTLSGVYVLFCLNALEGSVNKTADHPLAVTRAALEAGGQITSMHRYMKDVVLSKTEADRNAYIERVNGLENETFREIRIIRGQILGDDGRGYAESLENDFRAWRVIRENVISLVAQGETARAEAITREEGARHVDLLMGHVTRIKDHASGKALSILQDSETTAVRARIGGVVSLGLAILACLVLAQRTAIRLQREIEQRTEAEDELRREQEFMDLVLDSQSDTFFVFDPRTGKALRWNKAFGDVSGFSDAEISQMSAPGDWYDEEELKSSDPVPAILANGIATVELSLRTKSGERIPTEYVATCVKDDSGTITHIISIGRDVRERKRVEAEQREMDRHTRHVQKLESLGILAGGIAHDFNNILVGILGNVGLVLSDMAPDSPDRESLEHVDEAARRAADLCRQMLAYAGKGRFVVEALDLNELIHGMQQLLKVSVAKNVRLQLELADRLPAIMADATQLRQVVLNLVVNASEAIGEEKGVVTVATGLQSGPAGKRVSLCVADDGCGMDTDTRTRMFEPFFTTKFVGRGLGLSAVQGIVRGHTGTLTVDSEIGNGTRIQAFFPVSKEQPEREVPAETGDISSWRSSGGALVIDDEPAVLLIAERSLDRAGLTAHTASDGREGMVRFKELQGQLRCVLLDLTMPHMNGEETLTAIRQIDPHIPVVLMSGYDEHDIMRRFEGRDVAGFIQKPFTHITLLKKVRAAIDAPVV